MIKLLGELFNKEEEKLNYDNLTIIFTIFKNILIISNQNILEMFVEDDFYPILLGVLECKIILITKMTMSQFSQRSL